MSVFIINGVTVTEFVEDGEAFNRCVEEQFSSLDVNGDGVLSPSELRKGFEGLKLLGADSGSADEEIGDLYDVVFEKFDTDHSGSVDMEEFRMEMKEIMMAVARGIGNSPIQMALESGSFLMKAVQHESTKRM
ncbi:uncharacterized protein LOC143863429 [Tasmannia lanceolata]|uniref:uncharacterized protein LOC143863429 n=1 Tax=Tasmannia lanceolata TaxID=3420 RepID=UPI0040642171